MTNEEIKKIEFAINFVDYCTPAETNEDVELAGIAIEALEKQIPRKVIRSIYNVRFCPICQGSVWQNRYESKYCFRCGQALKWENKKDD
ncbi:MAG: hypothetical protein II388_10910 [Clostridia bacterium]|nr:hypothetical protein [Clostridia bacterium]